VQIKNLKVNPAPSLARLSTIRLGGSAIAELLIEDPDALEYLPETLKQLGGRPVVLGRGSNILAKDGNLPLVLIRLGENFRKGGVEKLDEDSRGATFKAAAALPLPVLVNKVCGAGFAGLSGLAGIPGSVGGAVAMNAGAFGMDIRGVLCRVNFYSPERGLFSLAAEELEIAYRHFAVPGLEHLPSGQVSDMQAPDKHVSDSWFIILSAEFYCLRSQSRELLQAADSFMRRKQNSQPVQALSAGCVFKNPASGPAGRLLEEAGFKGKQKGGMLFSDLHANFLVNTGTGTAAEALELVAEAQEKVFLEHGVRLEPEVRIWG
jgi:UDP-N-acetylmuramate dehydrogenase